jgi:probable HAF family extracellular repeat protein
MRAIRFRKAVRLVVTVGTLALALAPLTATPVQAHPATLEIHDLGTLPGGTFSGANDINNRGWVVGESGQATGEGLGHAFLWRNGRMRDLGTLGGESSRANGINDRGWVVGATETGGPAVHAFLWRNGRMRDLGTLGGAFSEALEVNDRGVVVGNSETASGTIRPFIWYRGVMRELNVAGTSSSARAINNRGQVTGATTRQLGLEPEAYRWQRGRTTFLGTLPAPLPSSSGNDINDRGWVVGSSLTPVTPTSGVAHAVLWRGRQILDLGALGAGYSDARGVNNRGWVVGESEQAGGGRTHAFLWRKGRMIDLGTLIGGGGGSSTASAVNDRGVIAGTSDGRAVIWRRR